MIKFHDAEIDDEHQLFGRSDKLKELRQHIADEKRLIIVTGLRRIGKSSLIRCVLKKQNYSIFINAWDLGNQENPTRVQILNLFRTHIQEFFDAHKDKKELLKEFFHSISELHFDTPSGGFGITFRDDREVTESTIATIFHSLNRFMLKVNDVCVIAIDEIQEFGNPKDIDLTKIFATFFTPEHSNLRLILTGSEMGTLHDFVDVEDENKPFYGRHKSEVHLTPFDAASSRDFLTQGLTEGKIKLRLTIPYEPILERAVSELGGITGWLTYFGLECVDKRQLSEPALDETKKFASKLIKKEFNKFLELNGNDTKYVSIVKELTKSSKYNFIEFIKQKNLQDHLQKLIKFDFIHKATHEEVYFFADPLVSHYFGSIFTK